MQKVLITGISGYLGLYLVRFRPKEVTLSGTIHKARPSFPDDVKLCALDLKRDVENQLQAVSPDVVIHTAAMSGLAECQYNEKVAMRVNAEATEELARWCQEKECRLIYLSTDIVFDGKSAPYSEEDKAEPVNVYGHSKLAGEQAVKRMVKDYVICRISLVLGRGIGGRKNFIDWLLQNLESGKNIPLFADEIRTPVSAKDAAKRIWDIALSKRQGIYHCFGSSAVNRYTLGKAVCFYLGKDDSKLKSVSLKDAADYPRPANVALTTVREDNEALPPALNCLEIITNGDVIIS